MAKQAGGPVVVIMYDQVMYTPGGTVGKWGLGVGRELQRTIRNQAPLNKRPNKNPGAPPVGHLKSQIHRAVTTDPAAREIIMTVSSDAEYSTYVIFGTDRIFKRNAKGQFSKARGGMKLPGNPGFPPVWRQSVRGQKANDFMSRGVRIVSLNHKSLQAYRENGNVVHRV